MSLAAADRVLNSAPESGCPPPAESFGAGDAVTGLGDIDADGFADFAVRIPRLEAGDGEAAAWRRRTYIFLGGSEWGAR